MDSLLTFADSSLIVTAITICIVIAKTLQKAKFYIHLCPLLLTYFTDNFSIHWINTFIYLNMNEV